MRFAVIAVFIAGLFAISAAGASADEYLQGGGFEGGIEEIEEDGEGHVLSKGINQPDWIEQDNRFVSPTCSLTACGSLSGTGPHAGTNWVLFGGYPGSGDQAQSVSQTVTTPEVEQAELTLAVWIGQFDLKSANLTVEFDGEDYWMFSGGNPESVEGFEHGYEFLSVLLEGGRLPAGQHTVRLSYEAPDAKGEAITLINVDDVSLTAKPVAAPAPPPQGAGGVVSASGSATPKPAPDTRITRVQLYRAIKEKTGSAKRPAGFRKSTHAKPAGAKFTFGGDGGEGALRFQCSIDGAAFTACNSPASYRKLKLGMHHFAVRAVDGAGTVDPTPATYGFKATASRVG